MGEDALEQTLVSQVRERKERKRVLSPEDRKLFFSLVSLLVEPGELPVGGEISCSECEWMAYIPKKKHHLVIKLMDELAWDCS